MGLTAESCPNCDGEGQVEVGVLGEETETGQPIVDIETCRFCDGRGGFGLRFLAAEMAVTTGEDVAAE